MSNDTFWNDVSVGENKCFGSKTFITMSLKIFGAWDNSMSWKDGAFWCLVLVGILLFLYGANRYNPFIGWVGVYLLVTVFILKVVSIFWAFIK